MRDATTRGVPSEGRCAASSRRIGARGLSRVIVPVGWATNMLSVGQDLFAMCGKCDAEWHVVVAMDGGKVTKVQCKQCMGYHRYRVPPGEVDVNRNATGRRQIASPKARKNGRTVAASTPVVASVASGAYDVATQRSIPTPRD